MISQYMESLTYEPLPFTRNIYNRYIYKNSGDHYIIRKIINGKQENYGTYNSLEEARTVRDQLIENNWDKTIVQGKLDQEAQVKKYYHHITCNGRYYTIFNHQNKYSGHTKTIEEALYYRDLTFDLDKEDMVKPNELDLVTGNPYLDGLEVPLPDRLVKTFKGTDYGTGHIMKKGKQSYHVYYGGTYYCACPTYEMAYYMRQELNKADWDKSQLKSIQRKHGWSSMVMSKRWVYPQKYKKKDGTVKIMGYSVRHKNKDKRMINYGYYKDKRVAELVRDLLIENDWNKDFLQTIQEFSFYCIRELDHNWRCQLNG